MPAHRGANKGHEVKEGEYESKRRFGFRARERGGGETHREGERTEKRVRGQAGESGSQVYGIVPLWPSNCFFFFFFYLG